MAENRDLAQCHRTELCSRDHVNRIKIPAADPTPRDLADSVAGSNTFACYKKGYMYLVPLEKPR